MSTLLPDQPSLAMQARHALERTILAGDYLPGERLVEERLCAELGISRPPLREALKELAHTGLVEHIPRKGVRIMSITQHDVFEIATLRRDLERMALRLALPDLAPERVERCRAALREMERIAESGTEGDMVSAGFEFHFAVVGLAGHGRIESTYRAMAMQLQMCMVLNNQARREIEDLDGNVARHARMLDVILTGDPEAIEAEFDDHGNLSFLIDVVDRLDGATPESDRWLEEVRSALPPAT
ncbi:GntR family transcriptional regulator [Brevibacterium casei]|uniref:GntR family transcriptional regulator n=1 Tax=Brevibacterium casei TaxID=33889 RepID=UPI00186BAA13|nr:GntR family transcriptional regulator [Brevibacterium casei]MBE4694532.1 GntR family transcriptional regulator [Brevibacterium casei]MBY3577654.1 GntR family transcriptional regulator [Brevibacterium casei]